MQNTKWQLISPSLFSMFHKQQYIAIRVYIVLFLLKGDRYAEKLSWWSSDTYVCMEPLWFTTDGPPTLPLPSSVLCSWRSA